MVEKIIGDKYIFKPVNQEKERFPSAQETLSQATLRLGGPSGEVVKVEDIRYYLGARLLLHLVESGDRTSKNYQLLQEAQDLSSPTGVQAAIEVFKTQSDFLREELSTTPKDKRDRDLIREGVALGLSVARLEKMLREAQKPTVVQKPGPSGYPLGNEAVQRQTATTSQEEIVKAASGVWLQPVGHKITGEEVDILLDASFIIIMRMRSTGAGDPVLSDLVLMSIFDSVKKARDYKNNNEGREAVVELVRMQGARIKAIIQDQKFPNADEGISRVKHVVTSVQELMGEFGKGSNKS